MLMALCAYKVNADSSLLKWYDLGGISPEGNPGVYHFKSGLSGVDSTHIRPLSVSNDRMKSAIIRSSETAYSTLRRCARKLRGVATFPEKVLRSDSLRRLWIFRSSS